jgi:hypothetical protein
MSLRIRSLVAAVMAAALVFSMAAPALADDSMLARNEREHSVPPLLDAIFLRPIGMVVTVAGAAGFAMLAPLMALTRPSDLGKPFHALVVRPARYTWIDPLGTH